MNINTPSYNPDYIGPQPSAPPVQHSRTDIDKTIFSIALSILSFVLSDVTKYQIPELSRFFFAVHILAVGVTIIRLISHIFSSHSGTNSTYHRSVFSNHFDWNPFFLSTPSRHNITVINHPTSLSGHIHAQPASNHLRPAPATRAFNDTRSHLGHIHAQSASNHWASAPTTRAFNDSSSHLGHIHAYPASTELRPAPVTR